ncbi:low temperature requirement protein A [Micromonospora sp. NPDC051543]|uniref:low temperature requirement protein A n=1 Tax=Micromonospora sp. NPDC051543 TaxID=3364287 RepID=UPI0037B3E7E4
MASRPERLLRGSDASLSASFLELFFDLAFVLALSQTAQHLLGDLTLDTNRNLTEAIALYRSAGYREIPPYNTERYAHHWFEKPLAR